jgi:hypothetical protein
MRGLKPDNLVAKIKHEDLKISSLGRVVLCS